MIRKALFISYFLILFKKCNSAIILAHPVQHAQTQLLFNSLAEALEKQGHLVTQITPDERNWTFTDKNVAGVDEYKEVNYFLMSEDYIKEQELNSITNGIKMMASKMTDAKFVEDLNGADAIIVPMQHRAVVAPLFKEPRKAVLITVCVDGFDFLDMGMVSGNALDPVLFPIIGGLFDPLLTIIDKISVNLLFVSAIFYRPFKAEEDSLPRIRLTLINDHHLLTESLPLLPSQVQLPGLGIRKAFKTQELSAFLADAKKGVIYFDLGEEVKSTHLPNELRDHFLDAFNYLKMKVVWRYEGSGHLRKNQERIMKIQGSVHQSFVLSHENTKLFITTCDMGSVQLGLYHGVPMLCIPLSSKHKRLAELQERKGRAIKLDWETLDRKIISANLERLMGEDYLSTVTATSMALSTEPVPPYVLAAWHVIHAIKTKDASFQKYPGIYLYYWQMRSLDIVLIMFFAAAGVLVILNSLGFPKVLIYISLFTICTIPLVFLLC